MGGGCEQVVTEQKMASSSPIDRREFMQLCAASLALAAAGCRRNKDRAYARGNTLTVAVSNDFDRPLCPNYDGEFLMFLPLVRENELTGDRQGCLATRWEHSADYLEWTYRLRPNVRWHDGRPVTMEDVTFTLELHSRPNSPYAEGLPLTESVTVHDESTFTVRGINWLWQDGMDSVVSILPKHLVQDLDVQKFYEWDFWLRPVGCGPFRYLRDVPQTMVELEANPDYYKGVPRIARVVLKFAGQAGLTELLSGNVDAIDGTNPAQLSKLANDPRFRTFTAPIVVRSWVIYWQNEHPLFRDRDVRRALSLAINRRELLQVLNLPSQFPLADGVYTRRQFQRGELPAPPRYDPAEARRLLDQAGWRERSRDGIRERGGRDFRFTALTLAEPGWDETALYVQDQYRDIGVRMDLQPLERSAGLDRLKKTGEFEAIMTLFVHASGNLGNYFGERARVGYRNPRLTRLIELTRTTADPHAVDQAYRQMSDILRADQPVAFLLPDSHTHIVHRRVKGLSALRPNPLLFTEDLWLEDER